MNNKFLKHYRRNSGKITLWKMYYFSDDKKYKSLKLCNLSFSTLFDEKAFLVLISQELQKQLPQQSILDSFLGDVEIRIDAAELHNLSIDDNRIDCKMEINMAITPQWSWLFLTWHGKLALEMTVHAGLDKETFIRAEINIHHLDWIHGPYLTIGGTRLKACLVNLISQWVKKPVSRQINGELSHLLDRQTLARNIAQQMKPFPLTDRLYGIVDYMDLQLCSLQLLNGHIQIIGEIDLDLQFVQEIETLITGRVLLTYKELEMQSDFTYLHFPLDELNTVLMAHLDDINRNMLERKDLLSQLQLRASESSLEITVETSSLHGAKLAINIKPELKYAEQEIDLVELEVHPGPDSGMVMKTLTTTLRGLLKKMIRRQFPVKLKPIFEKISQTIGDQGPEFINISASIISLEKLDIQPNEIVILIRTIFQISTTDEGEVALLS